MRDRKNPRYTYHRVAWKNYDHLLGTMTDKMLAKKIGIGYGAVFKRRIKLKIPAFDNRGKKYC